jgi:hypothetical protein
MMRDLGRRADVEARIALTPSKGDGISGIMAVGRAFPDSMFAISSVSCFMCWSMNDLSTAKKPTCPIAVTKCLPPARRLTVDLMTQLLVASVL